MAQDAGRGDGPGWTAAHEWRQTKQMRYAARRPAVTDVGQSIHEPLSPALAAAGTRRGVSSSCRGLCRRLRHSQPRARGGGTDVDASGHDTAWPDRERSEDGRARCTAGALRLPGLQLRPALLSEGWSLVFGSEPVTEERAAC